MQDHWIVQVKATPEQIWPLVGDLQHHGDWSPKSYRANWLSGEPNAVGSTFESFGWLPRKPENRMEGQVIQNDAPQRFAVRTKDDMGGTFTITLALSSDGDTTTVEKTVEAPDPTGFMKVMWPVLSAVLVHPGTQKGMDMLKAKAEAESAPGASGGSAP
jgi:Polyketide cyclase / dehydrase and lipid transport